MITVPQLQKISSWPESHIYRCLVTLFLEVVFYYLFDINSLNIRFEMGVLNTLKYTNSSTLVIIIAYGYFIRIQC